MKIKFLFLCLIYYSIGCNEPPEKCLCFDGKMGDYNVSHQVISQSSNELDSLNNYFIRLSPPNDSITQPYVRNFNKTHNLSLIHI